MFMGGVKKVPVTDQYLKIKKFNGGYIDSQYGFQYQ